MTREQLTGLVAEYRAALVAANALLDRLQEVADRQRDITSARNFGAFRAQADERERLMHGLMAIELHLRAMRASLAAHPKDVRIVPGFEEVARLQERATNRVGEILATDRRSIKVMADAELARRAALASLERGDTTLAAYRKVLAPPQTAATLVNRRG